MNDEPLTKKRKLSNKLWDKRRCAVVGCSTCVGMGIPLHRFHQEEEILYQWISATDVNTVSKNTLVCGLHFKATDYFKLGKFL